MKLINHWNRKLKSAYENLVIHQEAMHNKKFPFEQREVARNCYDRTIKYIDIVEETIRELSRND